MARTKIFFFIPSLIQGGAERQILELIGRLPPRFEPVLALWEDKIHYRDHLPPGQPKHVLGTNRMTVGSFRKLVEILRAERPAIFHSYLNNANFWGRLAAFRAEVPIVISSCRARMIEWRYLAFERLLAERSDAIVVNSMGIQNELVNLAGVPSGRVRIVHNFLDLEHFRPPTAAERQEARARWGLPADARVVLMPGRISVQKHQLGLLLAFDRLVKRGALPESTILLMPGRRRPVLIDKLVNGLAGRPRLRNVVRIPGVETDMRSLYWASDLLALFSLWEGLPNVALEAAACGLPAVVSHAANLDGIVDHRVTGWEVPSGDHFALAHTLADVLALPPDTLAGMGIGGRERMERLFSPERVLGETVSMYDSLLEKEPRCAA